MGYHHDVCGIAIALDLHKRHGIHGYVESNLGFNTYELLDLDSPDSAIIRHASRHELEEIRTGDLDLDLAFEPKMKELPTASYPATKPAPSSSRFVRVSPDCLDQLCNEIIYSEPLVSSM